MSPTRGEIVRLQLSSDPRYLCLVRAAVRALCTSVLGFDEGRTHGIVLAVDEACANVMRHAYLGRLDGPLDVSFHVEKGGDGHDLLVVRVLDSGVPPDPDRVASSRPVDPLSAGGLGLPLMRGIMERVEFRRADDGGNVLELAIPCPPTAEPPA